MKNMKYLSLIALLSLGAIGLASCSESNTNQSSGEEDSTITSESNSGSSHHSNPFSEDSSDSEGHGGGQPGLALTFEDFQSAIDHSKPTRINTNQTFALEDEDILLHYSSSLTIEYGSEIKTCYAYSYEKLNEIETGNEDFISTVSGTLYSVNSGVYDGVDWNYKAEKVVTLSAVDFKEIYLDETDTKFGWDHLVGFVKNENVKPFLGGVDYGVKDLWFKLTIGDDRMVKLELDFYSHVDCLNVDARIRSTTTFGYEPQTVNIPE